MSTTTNNIVPMTDTATSFRCDGCWRICDSESALKVHHSMCRSYKFKCSLAMQTNVLPIGTHEDSSDPDTATQERPSKKPRKSTSPEDLNPLDLTAMSTYLFDEALQRIRHRNEIIRKQHLVTERRHMIETRITSVTSAIESLKKEKAEKTESRNHAVDRLEKAKVDVVTCENNMIAAKKRCDETEAKISDTLQYDTIIRNAIESAICDIKNRWPPTVEIKYTAEFHVIDEKGNIINMKRSDGFFAQVWPGLIEDRTMAKDNFLDAMKAYRKAVATSDTLEDEADEKEHELAMVLNQLALRKKELHRCKSTLCWCDEKEKVMQSLLTSLDKMNKSFASLHNMITRIDTDHEWATNMAIRTNKKPHLLKQILTVCHGFVLNSVVLGRDSFPHTSIPDDNCVICCSHLTLDSDDAVVKTKCDHYFHIGCLNTLYVQTDGVYGTHKFYDTASTRCPSCRAHIENTEMTIAGDY